MGRVAFMTIFAGLCAIFGCSAKGFVSVDAERFAREIAKSGVQLVDVRTADEYAEGHIPNAINVANETIGTDEIPELPNKNQLIMVYCRSGIYSARYSALGLMKSARNIPSARKAMQE